MDKKKRRQSTSGKEWKMTAKAVKTVKKISVIPAIPLYDKNIKPSEIRLRVAAYCRVSTEQEEQEGSYQAQVEYYTKKIDENPKWVNAGIYADDGKSATSTKKRDDFRAMIKDALDGKIDIILTKSISRFARNTVDALTIIRQLKEKNVAVIFEKEGINTLDATGELLITILSSLAQEESRNISENVKWGIARKFEKGTVMVNHNKFMGYTKNEEGELVIDPEEAKVVRLIFRLYLEGASLQDIADELQEKNIMTVTGKEEWHASVILKMLKNEKYMGDALLQKTYTTDFMTKKRVKNEGIVPQYYVEGSHEAIIPKPIFFLVQEELFRRAGLNKSAVARKKNQKSKYSSQYALTGILLCGDCGQEYRRVTWARNGKKKIVWRCSNRLQNGTEKCGASPTIEESALHDTIMRAINRVARNDGDFIGAFRQNVMHVIGSYGKTEEEEKYDEQIREKELEMVSLIEEQARNGTYGDAGDDAFKKIADEINELKDRQLEERHRKQLAENYEQRITDMDEFLQENTVKLIEFDDELVRRIVSRINVLSENKIQIILKSGIILEEVLV